jgi:hypothetical protein
LQGRRDRLHIVRRSSSNRVTSSTNSGTPPLRSETPAITPFDKAWRIAISPTMRTTSHASSGASVIMP